MNIINPESCQDKTDEELAGLIKENTEYFVCLMRRYEKRLLLYLRRLVGFQNNEIEDILQEAFIKIFYNIADFDCRLRFSSWAYRIVHNEAIDFLRKRKNEISADFSAAEWQNLKSEINWQQTLEQKFDHEYVAILLNKLKPKYRDVLVLKFQEDHDYAEISDILQKPPGTVATLINRAKKKLKEELEKNNFTKV